MTAANRHVSLSLLFGAAAILGMSECALGADMPLPTKAPIQTTAPIETWSFRLTPYVWLTALNGSATAKGRTVDVSASFVDILEHTKIPIDLFQVAAFGELRYGRFALLTDLAYMKVGINTDFVKSRAVDRLNASVGAAVGAKAEMFIAEFAAAYELARWSGIGSAAATTSFEAYAGGRAWWQRGELQLSATGTVNIGNLTLNRDLTLAANASVNWVDPVVGARVQHRFAPGLDLLVSGDIGGFGAGSKFSWQAIGAVNYEFARCGNSVWSGFAGYKALYADYEKGSGLSAYEYNIIMHGPILGLSVKF